MSKSLFPEGVHVMDAEMDFYGKQNHKMAYYKKKNSKVCSECGLVLCVCQTSLFEFTQKR